MIGFYLKRVWSATSMILLNAATVVVRRLSIWSASNNGTEIYYTAISRDLAS